jgi:hypothetical protein
MRYLKSANCKDAINHFEQVEISGWPFIENNEENEENEEKLELLIDAKPRPVLLLDTFKMHNEFGCDPNWGQPKFFIVLPISSIKKYSNYWNDRKIRSAIIKKKNPFLYLLEPNYFNQLQVPSVVLIKMPQIIESDVIDKYKPKCIYGAIGKVQLEEIQELFARFR